MLEPRGQKDHNGLKGSHKKFPKGSGTGTEQAFIRRKRQRAAKSKNIEDTFGDTFSLWLKHRNTRNGVMKDKSGRVIQHKV